MQRASTSVVLHPRMHSLVEVAQEIYVAPISAQRVFNQVRQQTSFV